MGQIIRKESSHPNTVERPPRQGTGDSPPPVRDRSRSPLSPRLPTAVPQPNVVNRSSEHGRGSRELARDFLQRQIEPDVSNQPSVQSTDPSADTPVSLFTSNLSSVLRFPESSGQPDAMGMFQEVSNNTNYKQLHLKNNALNFNTNASNATTRANSGSANSDKVHRLTSNQTFDKKSSTRDNKFPVYVKDCKNMLGCLLVKTETTREELVGMIEIELKHPMEHHQWCIIGDDRHLLPKETLEKCRLRPGSSIMVVPQPIGCPSCPDKLSMAWQS